MTSRLSIVQLGGLFCLFAGIAGCAGEYSMLSASGTPLLLSRRGYTAQECTAQVKDEASRMGVTLRYIHIRGNTIDRSLLWPFQPGYACEAAIGPEQGPIGTYPGNPRIVFRRS